MFTSEQKFEMQKMRSQGKSLQYIGDKYDVTRERVRQILAVKKRYRSRKSLNQVVYPMIRQMMADERISIKKMSCCIGNSYETTKRKLRGESQFKQNEIDTICGMMQQSYEVAFRKEKKENESV